MKVFFPTDQGDDSSPDSICYKSCRSLIHTVTELTGITLSFFSPDGRQITKADNLNSFCHCIYKDTKLKDHLDRCVAFHKELFEKSLKTKNLAVKQCPFGFKSFALPLQIGLGDEWIYVLGGHFFSEFPDNIIHRLKTEHGITDKKLIEKFKKTPILDDEKFQAVIERLREVGEMYQMELSREEQDKKISRVMNFISQVAKQLTGEIRLKELLLSIVEKVSSTFDVDKCAIALWDESRQFIEVFASNNEFADEIFGGKIEPGKNATGIVLETGETFYSYDAQKDSRLSGTSLREWKIKSLLSVPLKIGDRSVGLMHMVSQKRRRIFQKQEIEFAEALGSEISLLIEIAKLYNQSEKKAVSIARSRDEIKSYFTRIGSALSTSLDLKQLLKLIVELSLHLTHADAASIYLIENKHLTKYVAAAFEKRPQISNEDFEEIEEVNENRWVLSTSEHYIEKRFGADGITSYLGIPLERKGEVKGLLNIVVREGRKFTPEEVELLSIFAGHAALAIDNARLFVMEKRKAKEATILHQAAKSIGECISLADILKASAEELVRILDINRCLIMQLDYKKLELYTAEEIGLSEEQKDFFSFYRLPIDEINDELWNSLVHGKPVHLTSAPADCPAIERFFKAFPTNSCLLVPLLTKEQLIGIIYLDDSRLAHNFNDTEIRLVMTLTIQIASAIQRASLVEKLKSNLDRLKALHQVSTAVTGTLSLDRVFELVVDKASHLIEAPAASLLSWNEETREYELEAGKGLADSLSWPQFHKMISEKTARRRNYIARYLSSESESSDPLIWHTLNSAKMGGYISIPLIARKRVVGVLNCFCVKGDKFESQEIRLLRSFANQAAIAVENARLYALIKNKVRELATVFEVGKSIASTLDLNKVLNEITSSVVKVMSADAASIMLLDEKNQVLKIIHTHGLGKYHKGEYIKVGAGTAGIAAKMGRPMVLHDDEGNSSPYKFPERVRRDNMKTILSIPMKVRDKVIGLINLYRKPIYHFTAAEINLLSTMANQAAVGIENARLYNEQFDIAQIIQKNLMPASDVSYPNMEIGQVYIPSEILSGDYFEVIPLGENRYGLVIADVSGKGTGAAIYNARAKYIIHAYAVANYSPSDILYLLNEMLVEETQEKFLSLLYIDLDVESYEMIHSSAGHEPLIIWDDSEKEVKLIESSDLPIAIFPETNYNQQFTEVGPGDILVLYTDGIVEARSREGEFFGTSRLIEIIRENHHLSAQTLANKVYTRVQKFTRRRIHDDFSLLVIKL